MNFHGNPLDPVAQFGLDDANVVGEWLPPEAVKLEEKLDKEVPWLHRKAETIWDLVPNRFRVGGDTKPMAASRDGNDLGLGPESIRGG